MRSKFTILWKICSEENNKVGDLGKRKWRRHFFLRQKVGGGEADVKIKLAFRILSKYIGPDFAKRDENSGNVFLCFQMYIQGELQQVCFGNLEAETHRPRMTQGYT